MIDSDAVIAPGTRDELQRREVFLDIVVQTDRRIAQLQAHQARALSALVSNPIPLPTRTVAEKKQWVREEVASSLRISFVEAAHRIEVSRALTTELPATFGLLQEGAISLRHAEVIASATGGLPAAIVAKVEERVIVRAPEQTPNNFKRSVVRAVAQVAPKTAEERHAAAYADRRVVARYGENGMGELWASLPSPALAQLMTTVREVADGIPPDDRTADQRRADALSSLAHGASGAGAQIQVVTALSTLIGDDDQPAELAGAGPITASQARLLAFNPSSTWRRIITDPAERVISYGRKRYRPPVALREFVEVRDQVCVFPGCARRSASCDIDHHEDFALRGETSPENLGALCPRHHVVKHEAGWTITRRDDGTVLWKSPLGKRYEKSPPELPRDMTGDPDPPPF